ncbi:Root phototropism protein [Thalictrum thalictroides]|uniref:fructose-bisphosphate aldolase n=1 Tax=Thalictrum thalictroides TaxID=46969 RepID=A0A7J6W769_THATH|nr:Root phototropism protein [Thalictrum thalictroides]
MSIKLQISNAAKDPFINTYLKFGPLFAKLLTSIRKLIPIASPSVLSIYLVCDEELSIYLILCPIINAVIDGDDINGIANLIPKAARKVDEGTSKLIDEIEREKVCSVMDALKLSYEARVHASQNKRLPIQIVLHALYYDQLKLRSGDDDRSMLDAATTRSQLPEVNRIWPYTALLRNHVKNYRLVTTQASTDEIKITEEVLNQFISQVENNDVSNKVTPELIVEATMTTLCQTVPAAMPGIVFLSGGQSTLKSWSGKKENVAKTQEVFLGRCKANLDATLGKYDSGVGGGLSSENL